MATPRLEPALQEKGADEDEGWMHPGGFSSTGLLRQVTGLAEVDAVLEGGLVMLEGGVELGGELEPVGELVIDSRVVPTCSNSVANIELR